MNHQPTTGAVTLRFHEAPIEIIRIDGEAWVRGVDIGRCLGYKRPAKSIQKVFVRNSDEFTDEMTMVIQRPNFPGQLGDEAEDESDPQIGGHFSQSDPQNGDAGSTEIDAAGPGGVHEVRLFSARGTHLLAIFARTPIAAQFRRWALDVLDGACAKKAEPEPLTLAQEMSLIRLSVSLMEKVAVCTNMDLAEELFMRLMRVNRAMGRQTISFIDLALACRQRKLPLDDDLGDLAAH